MLLDISLSHLFRTRVGQSGGCLCLAKQLGAEGNLGDTESTTLIFFFLQALVRKISPTHVFSDEESLHSLTLRMQGKAQMHTLTVNRCMGRGMQWFLY